MTLFLREKHGMDEPIEDVFGDQTRQGGQSNATKKYPGGRRVGKNNMVLDKNVADDGCFDAEQRSDGQV